MSLLMNLLCIGIGLLSGFLIGRETAEWRKIGEVDRLLDSAQKNCAEALRLKQFWEDRVRRLN